VSKHETWCNVLTLNSVHSRVVCAKEISINKQAVV